MARVHALVLALVGAGALVPARPARLPRLRAAPEEAPWSERDDWALVDGARLCTRTSRTGETWLFYDELALRLGPGGGSRPAAALAARLEALGEPAPRDPRTLNDWTAAADGASSYGGALDGDDTVLVAARSSTLRGGAAATRYVETVGGELVRLGAPAAAAAAAAAADETPATKPPALLDAWGKPAAAALAAAALAASFPSFIGGAVAPDGPADGAGAFFFESTTTVTQKAKDDDGRAVLRIQRRRTSRTSGAPAAVRTDTYVRRESRDEDGNVVRTTTRDRAENPAGDAAPRAATPREMAALLGEAAPRGAPPAEPGGD